MKKYGLWIVLILVFAGIILGTLGTWSVPLGYGLSAFWPAIVVQVAGSAWFGGWGVLAAVLFPIFTNALANVGVSGILGFIPGNLAQGLIPAWAFRHFRVDPAIPGRKGLAFYMIWGAIIPAAAGGLLGSAAVVFFGEASWGDYPLLVVKWAVPNMVVSLLIGIPILRELTPLWRDLGILVKGWWTIEQASNWATSRRFRDMPIQLKLILAMCVTGLGPLLVLSLLELARNGGHSAPGNMTPLFLTVSLVALVLAVGFLSRETVRPLQELKEQVESLVQCRDGVLMVERTDEIGQLGQAFAFLLDDRRRADALLQVSEAKYRSLVNNASAGIASIDTAVNFTFVNPTLCEMLGYTEEELVGKPFAAFIHPDDIGPILETFQRGFQYPDEKPQIEYRALHKNGHIVHCYSAPTVIREKEEIVGFSAIIVDITERKRAEQALRESETIFTSFMEYSPVYIFFKDKEIRSLRLSKNYEQMLGMPISQMLGKTMDELFPSDLAKSMVEDDLRILNQGQRVDVVEEFGGRVYETTKFPIFKDGKPDMLAGFTVDITERKQMEDELRRWAHIFEHAEWGITVGSADGQTFELMNPAFARMHGYTIDELNGQSLLMVFAPEVWADVPVNINLAHEKGHHVWESIHVRKDGSRFPVLIDITAVYDEHGAILYRVVNVQDITERKRVEQALSESELQYRTTLEAMGEALHVVDRDLRFVLFNQAFIAWNQELHLPTEVLGKNLFEVFPFLPEGAREEYSQVFQTGELLITQDRTQLGGQEILTETRKIPIFHKDQVFQVLTVVNNITERKRAEEALREIKNFFQQVVDTSPNMIFVIDEQGRAVFVNQYTAQYYGMTPEQLISKSTKDVHHQETEAREFVSNDLEVIRSRKKIVKEELNTAPNGEQHWFYTVKVPLIRPDGTVQALGISTDITERKQAEEALRASNAKLETLVQVSPLAITLLDLNGNVQLWNPAAEKIFGWTAQEVIGHPNPIVPVNKQNEYAAFSAQILQGKPLTNQETVRQRKDGSFIDVSVSSALIFDAAGNVAGRMAIVADITERKQVEEALRQSEERLSSFMDSASDSFYLLDSDLRFVEINQKGLEITGKKKEDIIGKSITEIVPDVVESGRYERHKEVIRTGKSFVVEDFIPHPVFGDMHFILKSFKVGNGLGVIATDITERKRTEEALQESEARYRAISELISDYTFSVRVESDGRIVPHWVAGAFQQITEYSWEEFIALGSWPRIVHPDDLPNDQLDMEALLENRPINRELRIVTKSGKVRWILNSVQPVWNDQQGRVTGLIGAVRDISERKQAEETLRQRLAELEAVHTVSAALRTAQTLDEALSIVLDQTLTALETDAGIIWLYHPTSDELSVAIDRGWFSQLEEIPIKPGEGIAGTVFASGQAHLSTEFARDPLARPLRAGEIPAGWSGACVPIHTAAEAIGVLFISVPLPRQITPEQMKLLNSFAEMAGAALHRMRLYEETERQLKFLKALHEIDSVISASLDLRLTLQLLIEHAIAELGVDAADVLLLNPHLQTLDYVAGRGFRTSLAQTVHIRLGEGFAGRAALERGVVQAGPAQIQESPHFATFWASEGFTAYYGVPLIVKGEVKGVLEVHQRTPFSPEPHWLNFLETVAGQAAIAIDNMQLFDNMQRSNLELTVAYDTTIQGWSRALDLRDRETEGHTQRVAELTERLARAMGIGDTELMHVRHGALLHDIGKMGVPDSILLKPDKLTDAEWVTMRQHPQLAYDMLSHIEYLKPALYIPYCHHEKWDGTGYPRGLKGEQIPLVARIFAVVDVYDALTSDRPYRKAWSKEKTFKYIRSLAGIHFDPKVVEWFFRVVSKKK